MNSLLPPKIYVITTGDEKRKEVINNYLEGLEFEYVYSDDMDELKKLEKKYKSRSHKFRQKAIKAGEIGAFKTHAKAWELIVNSNRPGIVVEDNVDFIIEPSKLFSSEITQLINDCGLVSLSDFRYKLYHDKPFIISSIEEKKPLPTLCYGLVPQRAENLINSMKKTAYVMPVDKWLSVPKLAGVYGYVSHIAFAKRRKGLGSIANKHKGKKTFNPLNICFWGINKIKYNY
jgi:glycosyl transferase family 25